MIRAILGAQVRMLLSAGGRQVLLRALLFALWYGLWTALAFSLHLWLAEMETRHDLERGLMSALFALLLLWQFLPLMAATSGSVLNPARLLVYPISTARLFMADLLIRLATGLEAPLLLAGVFAGLVRNSQVRLAECAWVAVPLLLFLLFNLLTAAGLRNLLERLLTPRWMRALVIGLITLLAMAPPLLALAEKHLPGWPSVFERISGWFWPWTALVQLALGPDRLLAVAVAAVWMALATAFSWTQFLKALRFEPPAARQDAAKSSWHLRALQLPSLVLRDPLAAIVEKELRFIGRMRRFRSVFVMGLFIWWPLALPGRHGEGWAAENGALFTCSYVLMLLGQVTYWNTFGFDRGAVQAWYAWPVSMAQILAGKNLASLVYMLLLTGIAVAECRLLGIPLTPGKLAEALAFTVIVSVNLISVGNLVSVRFPKPIHDEKAGGWGAARAQLLLFVVYPLVVFPLAMAYLAREFAGSDTLFVLLLGFAAVVAGVVYWIAFQSALATAQSRKERILQEMTMGDPGLVA